MTRTSPHPIDRGWAWVVVVGVFINAFFMMGITKSAGMFLVELMDKFQVSTAFAGAAFTVCTLFFALGSPITGVLGESITQRKVMIFGGIIGMVGLSLCSFLVSMPYIIVMFGLGLGIGNSCSYGSGMVMIGKYFRTKRSLATGIALSGTSVGQFTLPPIIEYLLGTYGLGGTLLVIGALYLHCSLGAALLRPLNPQDVEDTSEDTLQNQELDSEKDSFDKTKAGQKIDNISHESEMLVQDGVGERGKICVDSLRAELPDGIGRTNSCHSLNLIPHFPSDTENGELDGSVVSGAAQKRRNLTSFVKIFIDFSILRNYVIVHFVFVTFCSFFAFFAFTVFTPAIAVDRGLTKYHKAMLISLSGMGDLMARLSTGYIADRNYIQRYKLKSMTIFVCAVNTVVFIFADSFAWMGVHCFMFGVTAGAYVCLMPVVILDFLSLEILSKALGMSIFALGFGGSLGQIFFGFIRDVTGSYTAVLLIQAFSMVLCGILLLCTPLVSRLEQKRIKNLQTKENGTKV